jgi:hypothetical protein
MLANDVMLKLKNEKETPPTSFYEVGLSIGHTF